MAFDAELGKIRDRAFAIWRSGLAAADPFRLVRLTTARNTPPIPDPGGKLFVVAVGKAAMGMARAAAEWLEPLDVPVETLVITNKGNEGILIRARVLISGHPVPDAAGLAAGAEVIARLKALSERDRVLALISGGASAMLPTPAEGLTLDDKVAVNRLLLASGAPIEEMNLVRQHLSWLKGGGMLRFAHPAHVTAIIISDVPSDDLRIIGSGPTVAPAGSRAEAREVLEARGLWERVPEAVRQRLSGIEETREPLPEAVNFLAGGMANALGAMASLSTRVHPRPIIGDVEDAAHMILLNAFQQRPGTAMAFGGETTVTLRGNGLGGRNQELAIRFAILAERRGLAGRWAFASAGTDGLDGPTTAAGGIVDSDALVRMRRHGFDPYRVVEENNSHPALEACGGLIVTGPTGTNVSDLMVFVKG